MRDDTAMTGELTLTGQVLPIGGLKEKALAAQDAGIKRVIAPQLNEQDIEDIPEHLRKDIEFIFVDRIEEVLEQALVPEGASSDGAGPSRRPQARARVAATAPPPATPAKRGRVSGQAAQPQRRAVLASATRCVLGDLVAVGAQRLRMADRADLGDVAPERQPDVQSATALTLRIVPGIWLMWYVRASHQAGKPRKVRRADLRHRLVAAEVHELALAAVA